MGYHTDFKGQFDLDKPLTGAHTKILEDFAKERHDDRTKGYPGIWCQWVPNEEGTALEWNQTEKFYEYEAWIEYLLQHYLIPWGYTLNGKVSWYGEDFGDSGIIDITYNIVESHKHADGMKQRNEALDEVLKKVPDKLQDKLPLFMGINKLLDEKGKKTSEDLVK